jgi:hypothetical protein
MAYKNGTGPSLENAGASGARMASRWGGRYAYRNSDPSWRRKENMEPAAPTPPADGCVRRRLDHLVRLLASKLVTGQVRKKDARGLLALLDGDPEPPVCLCSVGDPSTTDTAKQLVRRVAGALVLGARPEGETANVLRSMLLEAAGPPPKPKPVRQVVQLQADSPLHHRTVFHEAAHFVALTLLSVPPAAIVVGEKAAAAGWLGACLRTPGHPLPPAEEALVALFGPAAERWCHTSPDGVGGGDRKLARRALKCVTGKKPSDHILALITRDLADLLRSEPLLGQAVEQLAKNLSGSFGGVADGVLSGKDAETIIKDVLGDKFAATAERLRDVGTRLIIDYARREIPAGV